ncbi:MAG: hypothetical protein Q4C47_07605, partial [Planctomycetia bacterium]|nr:hypothetical protein [Planctomycetia bacterium]
PEGERGTMAYRRWGVGGPRPGGRRAKRGLTVPLRPTKRRSGARVWRGDDGRTAARTYGTYCGA